MSNITKRITISELSRLLAISRPTLYKYISNYETNEYDDIPKEYLDILKYIDKEDIYCKEQIYTYCMNKFEASSSKGVLDRIKILYRTNNDFNKFMDFIIKNSYEIDFKELLNVVKEEKTGND